jgi:hypothetical protein
VPNGKRRLVVKFALALAILAVVGLASGCVHDARPYVFSVHAPASEVCTSAQDALRKTGQVVTAEGPTCLVTPWQQVGETTAVTSTRSGTLEPIIIWRRYSILVQPDGEGATVSVSEERKTCPPDAPEVVPGTNLSPCVRQIGITSDEQQKVDRFGSDLRRLLLRTR